MPYIQGGGPQANSGLPEVVDVYHSDTVFANFVSIALWQDPQGPAAAVLAGIAAPTYKQESEVQQAVEGSTDEAAVIAEQKLLIASGVITQAQVDAGNGAGAGATNIDNSPTSVTTGTTTGAVALGSSVDETLLYDSPLTGVKYYVKTVTKQPGVIFPYDVATVAPANGITVQECCDNLRLLIINCIDPIKKQYPDMFITNTIRTRGNGAPGSQHPYGMACDIQYSKATKAEYFTRAQWVKNNIAFDQFLLEYKTTGTGKPWHHLSFNKKGNRAQVCTFMNDRNCKGPGVTGLYDLSNS